MTAGTTTKDPHQMTAQDAPKQDPSPRPQQDPLVVFMPSGRRGRFPVGTPC